MVLNRRRLMVVVLSLIGLVSLTVVCRQVFPAQPRTSTPQPGSTLRLRWEYCVVNEISLTTLGWKAHVSRGGNVETVDSDMTGISAVNRLGGEGWEVVNVVHEKGNSAEYFLKRPMR